MNRYILTSVHYGGAVQFNYDLTGLLVFYSVLDASLDEKQLVTLLQKIPREEHALAALNQKGYFTIKKIDEDLSFENFWEQGLPKIHRHRCEPFHKKISDYKKLKALQAAGPYIAYCERRGIATANPENYLKKEYWKTDWRKEI